MRPLNLFDSAKNALEKCRAKFSDYAEYNARNGALNNAETNLEMTLTATRGLAHLEAARRILKDVTPERINNALDALHKWEERTACGGDLSAFLGEIGIETIEKLLEFHATDFQPEADELDIPAFLRREVKQ